MFGVVPKAPWARQSAAGDRNRILMAMRPLIVRCQDDADRCGPRDKDDAKFHEIYRVDGSRNLDHALAEAGLSPDDIDIVLASHLHFDHAGGFTVRTPGRSAEVPEGAIRRPGESGRTRPIPTSETAPSYRGQLRAAGRGRRAAAGG
jgi:glyoxylase-like metal-dependent hydrolase (beta-lactamase superfamily II)